MPSPRRPPLETIPHRRMGCEHKSGSMWRGCNGAACQPRQTMGAGVRNTHPPRLQGGGWARGEHIHACEVPLKKVLHVF